MTRKRVARPPLPPACSHCRPYGGAGRKPKVVPLTPAQEAEWSH